MSFISTIVVCHCSQIEFDFPFFVLFRRANIKELLEYNQNLLCDRTECALSIFATFEELGALYEETNDIYFDKIRSKVDKVRSFFQFFSQKNCTEKPTDSN